MVEDLRSNVAETELVGGRVVVLHVGGADLVGSRVAVFAEDQLRDHVEVLEVLAAHHVHQLILNQCLVVVLDK